MHLHFICIADRYHQNQSTRSPISQILNKQSSTLRSETGKPSADASVVVEDKQHQEQIDQRRQSNDDDNKRFDDVLDDEDDRTSLKDVVAVPSTHNDSHVIAQIIEEYEMRLKEQVTMAKEDIVQALEEQIQVSGFDFDNAAVHDVIYNLELSECLCIQCLVVVGVLFLTNQSSMHDKIIVFVILNLPFFFKYEIIK